MPLFNKSIESITEDDIAALVAARTLETRELEFKMALPGRTDSERKEFLADVSSFANAVGGTIIYGIKAASDGSAEALPGIATAVPDAERLRLEHMIRTGLDPRLASIRVVPVSLTSGTWAFLVDVPRSFAAPHMVRESKKFFSRSDGGKQPLDTTEQLRAAFVGSEMLMERVRAFRVDRLSQLVAGETPIPVQGSRFTVFQVLPLVSFSSSSTFDVAGLLRDRREVFCTFRNWNMGLQLRYTFNGVLAYNGPIVDYNEQDPGWNYTEFYRTGCIEAVETQAFGNDMPGQERVTIRAGAFSQALVEALNRYMQFLRLLRVDAPYYVCLSLLNVKGVSLYSGSYRGGPLLGRPIGQENLIFPELLIEDLDMKAADIVKSTLDLLWNTCGLARCYDYDESGGFSPKP